MPCFICNYFLTWLRMSELVGLCMNVRKCWVLYKANKKSPSDMNELNWVSAYKRVSLTISHWQSFVYILHGIHHFLLDFAPKNLTCTKQCIYCRLLWIWNYGIVAMDYFTCASVNPELQNIHTNLQNLYESSNLHWGFFDGSKIKID